MKIYRLIIQDWKKTRREITLRQDQITLKKALSGNYCSHALNSTRRKFNLNLQKVTILENNKKVTYLVSAKTMRTLRKKGKI